LEGISEDEEADSIKFQKGESDMDILKKLFEKVAAQ
jgi:hypothetical protein